LKIVDSLERIEFYDLLPMEKLQVLLALFYKALCSDALDDFIEEKIEKWKELMRDSRADRAEERAQMIEERKKRREEKESAKKQEVNKTQSEQAHKQDGNETNKTEGEDKAAVSDEGVDTKNLDIWSACKRRRITVAEAQAERERQERQQMEKLEREARELKEQKRVQAEKRRAELRKEARKDELSRIKNIFRLEPIGFDRHLRRYWLFQSTQPGLYIEDGWLSIPENDAKQVSNTQTLTGSDKTEQDIFMWWSLSTMEDVDRLVESLTTRGMRESMLKAAVEENYKSIRESFNSSGLRSSTRSKDRDQLQALKENLMSIQTQLLRRVPGRAEEMAKFERRLDWTKSLEDMIPLTLETQEAINEACFHGTLLPDPARSGLATTSPTGVCKKTKPTQLERWRDAVQQATTYSRLQLLIGILDALIVWKKGLLCIPKAKALPTRRLSLRRGLRQANYKDVQSDEEEEEESAEEEESSGNESSCNEESDEEGSEELTSEESDDQSKRVTRRTTRAATKKSYKSKHNAEGSRPTGRTGTKRPWQRIVSSASEESDSPSSPSSPEPPQQAKKRKQNALRQTLNTKKASAASAKVPTRKRLRAPLRRSRRNTELNAELKECESILASLLQHEDSWPFRNPVDTTKVTDYEDLVKTPVDLSLIRDNLHMQYVTIEDFTSDMRLIFFNCEVYNHPNSEVAVAGKRLEAEFSRLLNERLPSVYYQPVYSDYAVGNPRKKRRTSRK
jgi:hypothetical protein